jgi:hypothetical protein
MKNLNVRRHGENIKPVYATSELSSGGAQSTKGARPDGKISGIVKRFSKSCKAAENPTALGLLKHKFSEAIEFTGISHEVRGLIAFMGLIAATIGLGFGQMLFFEMLDRGLDRTINKIFVAIAVVFIVLGIYVLLRAIRHEFFRPEDEPIIFDRSRQKVYRFFREVNPGVTGLFKYWPIHAAEYEWHLIDVEHNAILLATGSTITRSHSLTFIVRRSSTDPTIIDDFGVGNTIQLGESSVAPLWEHIRRFMGENGPHLPNGETVIKDRAPTTLWESMGAVGPIGPGYFEKWKTQRGTMVLYHLLFPLFLPMFLLWGFLNWLSYKTATAVQWPTEIIETLQIESA